MIAGVGAQPNVEWLAGFRFHLENGVIVDSNQFCAPGVAPSATWRVSRCNGHYVRIEHWQVATDHAGALARYWMTGEESPTLVPYFWSEQYGRKLQLLGTSPSRRRCRSRQRYWRRTWLGLYSR